MSYNSFLISNLTVILDLKVTLATENCLALVQF